MRLALCLLLLTLHTSAFASSAIVLFDDCLVHLLRRPSNPHVVSMAAEIVSERARGDKIIAVGTMAEFKLLMSVTGVPDPIRLQTADAIQNVLTITIMDPELSRTTISRVAKKVYENRDDISKLAFCTLGQRCTFEVGRDAHVFTSRTVAFHTDTDGSKAFEIGADFPAEASDPIHVIFLHFASMRSGFALQSFFGQATRYEVVSSLYEFAHRHSNEIRSGRTDGIFKYFTPKPKGFLIDEGFATLLIESQAEIVDVELSVMASRPLDEKRAGEKLLLALRKSSPPVVAFLRDNAIDAGNLFQWSRGTIDDLLR